MEEKKSREGRRIRKEPKQLSVHVDKAIYDWFVDAANDLTGGNKSELFTRIAYGKLKLEDLPPLPLPFNG